MISSKLHREESEEGGAWGWGSKGRSFCGEVQVKRWHLSERVESLGGCSERVKVFTFYNTRVTFDRGDEQHPHKEVCGGR